MNNDQTNTKANPIKQTLTNQTKDPKRSQLKPKQQQKAKQSKAVKCCQLANSRMWMPELDLRYWTQNCVFSVVWTFLGMLIRPYLLYLYGSSCIDRWLLKIPWVEHLIIQKSLVPAAGLFWILRRVLGHIGRWPVGAARALVGWVAGCAVCIIYNTLCSLLCSLCVALGCAGGKGQCIDRSFPSLGTSSRRSPWKRFGQNDYCNTLQTSCSLRSAWRSDVILQYCCRTEISCLRSEP